MAEITEIDPAYTYCERARIVAATGNFKYAIDLFLRGIARIPDLISARRELREISLQRASNGGKPLGNLEQMKLELVSGPPIKVMLACERLLCLDPCALNRVIAFSAAAREAGALATAAWMEQLIEKTRGT